ncbi:DUF3305 domain-containing protein [Rhodobacteraceae bacterium KN286]|uniref:DUF3305 domain-containing protein n=2 Tax=Oceanomicrobium pacificus TaxID=2692916 RepID=A0A6B0TPA4_9RHOB|nr:DUF3305 domain-containing protein [Oceanomicrobium pacificus]
MTRRPGVTRWSAWSWSVAAILPGAGPGRGKVVTPEAADGTVTLHAGTARLDLFRTDTEAYLTALNGKPPALFVILRHAGGQPSGELPELVSVTASAYEAQDYADNGEDLVERVPLPPALEDWIRAFVATHHREDPFVKRKRRDHRTPAGPDGIGDPRIRQAADIYRPPAARKPGAG